MCWYLDVVRANHNNFFALAQGQNAPLALSSSSLDSVGSATPDSAIL